MKDLNFSRKSLIISFAFVIFITVTVLDFSNPSFDTDGGKYFIIFSSILGLMFQIFRK